MKIILSRKGFDSQYGGVPSPIFPGGEALSLPIPASLGPVRFSDLSWRDLSVGRIVSDLTRGKVASSQRCHLDPDLYRDALRRSKTWRPAFGQVGRAQSHLEKQGVGPGDVFLFFGWFRSVEPGPDGSWRYVRTEPSVHRLYGWLQVGQTLTVGSDPTEARGSNSWLREHPHLNGDHWPKNNSIYVAARDLVLDGHASGHSGAGVFTSDSDKLTLTAPDAQKRSVWKLPEWFWPSRTAPGLSFHGDRKRWQRRDGWVQLNSVGRGQEFVLDVSGVPEATEWLLGLMA